MRKRGSPSGGHSAGEGRAGISAKNTLAEGKNGGMKIYADRSERGKLRFFGPQRAWFLHQIMTNSFDPLGPDEVREAALLTPHGRMVGYLEAVATDDAILVHFESELRATLPDAVRHYVFATQVEIADVTDEMGLVLATGDDLAQIPRGLAVQSTHALGAPAAYIWVEKEGVRLLVHELELAGYRPASEEALEAIRIENGAPRWGHDMNEKTLPQEARLEDVAIHFDKGCYVGQEAVAKIHFRGKVNRKLRKLEVDQPVSVGAHATLAGERVGVVTSSAGRYALAMLRHTVEPGTIVVAGDVEAKVVA
jgi:folate-binding protein YgfZ